MFKRIAIVLVVILVGFVIYVQTRSNTFTYQVSGVIKAPPEKIFPYLSDMRLGSQWSPYEQDTSMKKEYVGEPNQIGGKMIFESKDSGSGSLEIMQIVQNDKVDYKLIMTSPFYAENIVTYRLVPEEAGTRFVWNMSGENNFIGKLIGVFIDCEKMLNETHSKGIENLKNLVESQAGTK